MNAKQLGLATVAGGVTLFVVGYVLWGVAFVSFFEANSGTAVGVIKDPPDFLMTGLGQLAYGGFLAMVFAKWASISTAGSGLKAGAIIGLLVGAGYDLTIYGTTNLSNLTGTVVDILLTGVHVGIAGAVVGAVLGMTKTA